MSSPSADPLTRAPRLVAPVSARCNNACRFCDQAEALLGGDATRGGSDKVSQAWEQGRRAARGEGVLVLSGGEPTLLPDLASRVAALREAGAREVWIQTNGRMLAYRKLARSLAGAGVTGVECALHGHEPPLHDWLTRVEGSFRQTVAGAKNARRVGLRLVVNTALVRSNFRHVPALVTLCRRLGAERLRIHPLRLQGAAVHAAPALAPPRWLAGRYLDDARRRAALGGLAFEVAGSWAEGEV